MFDWKAFKDGRIAVFFRDKEEAERFFKLAMDNGCECVCTGAMLRRLSLKGTKPYSVCSRGPIGYSVDAYIGWYKKRGGLRGLYGVESEITAEEVFDDEMEYCFDAEGFLSLLD